MFATGRQNSQKSALQPFQTVNLVENDFREFLPATDGNFRLWSLLGDRLQLFRSVKAHKTAILAMVRDADSVWSCTKNGTLRQWSIALLLEDRTVEPGVLISSNRNANVLPSAAAAEERQQSAITANSAIDGNVPLSLRHAEVSFSMYMYMYICICTCIYVYVYEER